MPSPVSELAPHGLPSRPQQPNLGDTVVPTLQMGKLRFRERHRSIPWVSQPSSTKARTQTQAVRTCDWMRGSTYGRCPPAHSTPLSYCHSLTMGDRHREVKQPTRGHRACKWQNLGLQPPLHTSASTMGTGQRELARQPPPVPKDSVGKLRQLWVGLGSC